MKKENKLSNRSNCDSVLTLKIPVYKIRKNATFIKKRVI